MHLRTGIAPHLLWGMSEAEYVSEPGLAHDFTAELRSVLIAEDAAAPTPQRHTRKVRRR